LLQSMRVVGSHLGQFIQRMRSQDLVRRNAERMAEIVALQGRLADPVLDMAGIWQTLVDIARRLIGTGEALLQLVEDASFVYVAASEGARRLVGARIAAADNFSAAVASLGKPIRCDDALTDARIDPEAA